MSTPAKNMFQSMIFMKSMPMLLPPDHLENKIFDEHEELENLSNSDCFVSILDKNNQTAIRTNLNRTATMVRTATMANLNPTATESTDQNLQGNWIVLFFTSFLSLNL
jgi:hypothetical protein